MAIASPSAREATRVVAGQIVAVSLRQCNCSQHTEFLAEKKIDVVEQPPIHRILLREPFPFPPSSNGSSRFEGLYEIKRAVTTESRSI